MIKWYFPNQQIQKPQVKVKNRYNIPMTHIKELPEDLIKKIAAGEVIERPASVVKELVENSIDAEATKIEVEIARGGKHIKISDNGKGILSEDIPLLFKRHATSKLKSFDDLYNIFTLGFRGEALASISSISKIKCLSKNKEEEIGFEINIENGKINKKSSGISVGTVFEVDDLFYNIPVREKFLKSEQTEIGHIQDLLLQEALSFPQISFKLINNKNTLLNSSGSSDLSETIYELLGEDLKNNLIKVNVKNSFLEINGYISNLEITRSNKKSIFTFVNNRPVKCSILHKAISSVYEGMLESGKFPITVLNFSFKPGLVDVNVHPTKKEVRYTKSSDVYNFTFSSLNEIISKHYKNIYKERSIYQVPESNFNRPIFNIPNTQKPFQNDYSAALELYQNTNKETEYSHSTNTQNIQENFICKVENLRCYSLYSSKNIANMSKMGNKTVFEVGIIFPENFQIVFNGEIYGDESYQKMFFNSLSDLAHHFYKNIAVDEKIIQQQIIHKTEESNEPTKERSRKKPSDTSLYEIWNRDNWTCVYCGKHLIDPKTVKEAIKDGEKAFTKHINQSNNEITLNIFQEYSATYDHYLPVSKLPQFTLESENLLASCKTCNIKKSDSMKHSEWVPQVSNAWENSLEIGNLIFLAPNSYKIKDSVS